MFHCSASLIHCHSHSQQVTSSCISCLRISSQTSLSSGQEISRLSIKTNHSSLTNMYGKMLVPWPLLPSQLCLCATVQLCQTLPLIGQVSWLRRGHNGVFSSVQLSSTTILNISNIKTTFVIWSASLTSAFSINFQTMSCWKLGQASLSE